MDESRFDMLSSQHMISFASSMHTSKEVLAYMPTFSETKLWIALYSALSSRLNVASCSLAEVDASCLARLDAY